MQRAANDVMQSILFSTVLDAIAALKAASKGLPNNLLRDVQAIHPNVTFADLPKEVQDAISASVRTAFTQLLKEGYAVGPRQQMQATRPLDRVPERDRRGPADRRTIRQGAGRRGPRPEGDGPGGGPRGPGGGPGKGPGGGPRRPRPPKGKPKLS